MNQLNIIFRFFQNNIKNNKKLEIYSCCNIYFDNQQITYNVKKKELPSYILLFHSKFKIVEIFWNQLKENGECNKEVKLLKNNLIYYLFNRNNWSTFVCFSNMNDFILKYSLDYLNIIKDYWTHTKLLLFLYSNILF